MSCYSKGKSYRRADEIESVISSPFSPLFFSRLSVLTQLFLLVTVSVGFQISRHGRMAPGSSKPECQ